MVCIVEFNHKNLIMVCIVEFNHKNLIMLMGVRKCVNTSALTTKMAMSETSISQLPFANSSSFQVFPSHLHISGCFHAVFSKTTWNYVVQCHIKR